MQSKPKKLYLCGKMTGLPDDNYPEFNRIAAILRSKGYEVVNPAELKPIGTNDWFGYMRAGLSEMLKCDMVVCIGSDEELGSSRGATDEILTAFKYGIQLDHVDKLLK